MTDVSCSHQCTWPDCTRDDIGEQKPVATVEGSEHSRYMVWSKDVAAFDYAIGTPLYAAPPAQPAQRLTDDDIDKVTCVHFGVKLLPSLLEAHRAFARAIEAAVAPKWLPIETAPDGAERPRKAFVARAFNQVISKRGIVYTSDPYCVWRNHDGTFSRWPHEFPPTHWAELPAAPQEQKNAKERQGDLI